jgi:hypothetical protein
MLTLTRHDSTSGQHAYEVELQAPPTFCGVPSDAAAVLLLAASAALLYMGYTSSRSCALLPLALMTAVLAAAALHTSLFTVTKERLTVLRAMGVLLESHARCGASGPDRQFVDLHQIASVLINEGLTTSDIRYYLAFELRGRPDMAVAFRHLVPRLSMLQEVYREVHDLIAEDTLLYAGHS